MKFYLTIFIVLLAFIFPDKKVQRKLISDDDFNYAFYVSIKDASANETSKYYYWYKSGAIHSSQGSSFGNLLHGDYTKSYKNNNLAEKGYFKKGLKNKIWKKWHENGQLSEISGWKKGLKNGKYIEFTKEGKVVIQGNYKNNEKHGVWINEAIHDTLYFKKGAEIEKPKRYYKKPLMQRIKVFFKDLFAKKDENSLENSQSKKPNKPSTTLQPKKKKKSTKRDRAKKQKKIKEQN